MLKSQKRPTKRHRHGAARRRQNTSALLQWSIIAAVIALGIVAIFVFGVGNSGGGHGG